MRTYRHVEVFAIIASKIFRMNYQPGQKCLLDQSQPVVIVKPANRSMTQYVVEVPGPSVIIVQASRLTKVIEEVVDGLGS